MTEVGLGWLKGTIRGGPEIAYGVLGAMFGEPVQEAGGTRWYRSKASLADRTVLVAWDGIGGAAGTTLVDITQTALDGLGWDQSQILMAGLLAVGLKPSRLDLWMDDRHRRATARDVRAAIKAGQYRSHAQPGGYHEDDSTGAATAYLGARESERMLRVYDKDPNGDARTRYEIEHKGETARVVADLLVSSSAQGMMRTTAVELLRSFVDFVDRADGERGDRAPMLAWWSELVADFGRLALSLPRRVDSLARRVRWIVSQVAPTLAAVYSRPGYGSPWLNDVLMDGLDRAGRLAWVAA